MRQPRASTLITTAIIAALLTAVLTACGGDTPPSSDPTSSSGGAPTSGVVTSPTPTSTTTTAATPASTPVASGPPALPDNALFAISASVTTTGGGAADLYQVVYKPAPATAADKALLDKQCNFKGSPTWESQYPANILYLTSTLTATLHPGSAAFTTKDPVYFDLGWGSSAYSGSYKTFEAYCSAGYIQLPGTIHAVMAVPASNPAKGAYGWATTPSAYGFFGGGNDPGPDTSGTAVVSNCVVQLSPEAATTSTQVASWTTRPYKKKNACSFGIH